MENMDDHETVLITPTRGGRLGTNYTFESASGERLGEFRIHITKNNRLEGPGLDLRFGHEVRAAPTFFCWRGEEQVSELRYNVLTGGMELVKRDGDRILFEREGLLLPKVTLRDGSDVVLVVESDRLFGKRYTATLHPNDAWSRDDLVAVLGLVFHTKVSLGILFAATGGASAGLLAPL